MSKTGIVSAPRGFRDILPPEALLRERISGAVQRVFSSWGYDPVETPTLELVESLGQGGALNYPSFKFFDSDGEQLVLRPDVTLPIARLVATRMSGEPMPLRLRYRQSVFREERGLRGQARILTQLGVEHIGSSPQLADAELLLMLNDALAASGLTDYAIAFCTVSVLRSLLDHCLVTGSVDHDWEQAVLTACHQNDLVAVDTLAGFGGLPTVLGDALRTLVRLNGGLEAIRQCQALMADIQADGSLDAWEQAFTVAKSAESAEPTAGRSRFIIDFSVMSGFDYYTGLVLAAYAPGIGIPLASGGRYDGTLAKFGMPAPAAGFALNLERIVDALSEGGQQVAGQELIQMQKVVWK